MTESNAAPKPRTGGRGGDKQIKFAIGGAIVVLGIGYLILSSIQGATAYYLTVSELKAKGPSIQGKSVRVSGTIVGDTIEWNARDLILNFDIADDSGSLSVVYKGVRPDMFRDGAEAVVEGKYSGEGVFNANTLLLRCPSKYEEAAKATMQP